MQTIRIQAERIKDVRTELRLQLQAPESARTIDRLLCHHLSCSVIELYTKDNLCLGETAKQKLSLQLEQWRLGVPLAYLLGYCRFFSRRFEISDQAFIPRPETEQLAELALHRTKPGARVLDLGTGCGAIAVSLACEKRELRITACDLSEDCLTLARNNARRHAADSICFLKSNWFQNVPQQKFNLIVSNPPYIAEHDPYVEASVFKHEPCLALFAGRDGLDGARAIIKQAKHWLADGGILLLEHGWRQRPAVAALMHEAGLTVGQCIRDYNGLPRISEAFYRPNGGAIRNSARRD